MIRVYLRQAWQMIKQNPLFSCFHIVGTGIAIAMVMVMSIIYYIKIADIYPENNRSRMMVSDCARIVSENRNSSWYVSYRVLNECFYLLENTLVTAVANEFSPKDFIQLDNSKEEILIRKKNVDTNFWKVFPFAFVDGKPFTKEEFDSGVKTVVISQTLAKRLFGTDKVTGKEITLNYQKFKICGVVKDASYLMSSCYAQVWCPYTVSKQDRDNSNLIGEFFVYIVTDDFADVESHVNDYIRKVNHSRNEYQFTMNLRPYWKTTLEESRYKDTDYTAAIRNLTFILFILLLVPAINLSGMITSRMEWRMEEMGVRKAFGATRGQLINQVLWENLFLSCMGGLLGLLLSFLFVFVSKNWLLVLLDSSPQLLPDGVEISLSPDMFFNPVLFMFAFGICLILNMLSALYPAYKAIRKDIVYSLNGHK